MIKKTFEEWQREDAMKAQSTIDEVVQSTKKVSNDITTILMNLLYTCYVKLMQLDPANSRRENLGILCELKDMLDALELYSSRKKYRSEDLIKYYNGLVLGNLPTSTATLSTCLRDMFVLGGSQIFS